MAAYCSSPVVLRLALGELELDLMDDDGGFRISTVDLGYPDIREDTSDRPDQHGRIDYTRLFGARAVSIAGSMVPSATGSRQTAFHALAPFLAPGARPTLTYQIDADVTPRTITLRPSDLSAPISNGAVNAFTVGWKAPDPFAYDAQLSTLVVIAGAVGGLGRVYPLTFDRVYPAGAAGGSTATNNGDFTAYPTLRIYGPASDIAITEVQNFPAGPATVTLGFQPAFTIAAGDRVDVDTRTRTARLNGDPLASVYSELVWSASGAWPNLPPGVLTSWTFQASNTGPSTQMLVEWRDPFLL